jgi:amino acid transporter
LFAWAQLAVIRSGGAIGSVAYVFADYAAVAAGLPRRASAALAASLIVLLTALNILGVHVGRRAQNLLTVLKVLAIAGVIAAGFLGTPPSAGPAGGGTLTLGSFALAMVFILYAYSGWHEAAYVTAEVRDRRRNVPRALVAGAALITILYVLINAAYLTGLGYDKARQSPEIAAVVLSGVLGPAGGRLMAALVMVSALGSLNGSIFTGARIYRAMGADHRLFAPLAALSPRLGTPVRALLLQGVFSAGMVLVVGWVMPTSKAAEVGGTDPFDVLVKGTAPVFWLCFLLAGVSLFVFRARGLRPPFAVPGYPFVPLLFCGWCAGMLAGSVLYAWREAVVGLIVLALGVPLAWLSGALESKGT